MPRSRSLNIWLWLTVGLGATGALWLLLIMMLLALGRRHDARDVARFIPDCIVLFKRLLQDRRVPRGAKVGVALLVPYLALPFDIVPDFIPVAGQLDDAILVAAVIAYVVRKSGRHVVTELWPGSERGLSIVLALAPEKTRSEQPGSDPSRRERGR
ncbi:MAG: DUF1232 domain-containing protein [Actinomycetota bacterium]|nr:DUF1232 domain-containing protein [Actinomycetota bacterium]